MRNLLAISHTKPFLAIEENELKTLQNEIFQHLKENHQKFKNENFIHIPNLGKTFPNIENIISSDEVYNFTSKLFKDPILVQNNLFIKPPSNGIGIPWHIDFPYWQKRNKEIQFITLWINIYNAKTNGNIEYIEKSHLLSNHYLDDLLEGKQLESIMGNSFFLANKNFLSVEIDEGFGQYHHPLIMHKSSENKSDKFAISLGIVFSDESIIEQILALERGFPFNIDEGTTINDFVELKKYR